MDPIKILSMIASGLLGAFFAGYLFLPAYALTIFFVKKQYEKSMELQDDVIGRVLKPVKQKLQESVLHGLLAGFAGSVAAVTIGVTISGETFLYLFVIMILLLVVNIRYVCFSYAAAILIFSNLIFRSPGADVPSLLALAGIIHLLESVLVFLNADKDNMPVYIRHGDEISGAFIIQKFWPVPVVFLTVLLQGGTDGVASLINASWWPIFRPEALAAGLLALGLDCGLALLGYSNVVVTRSPEKRNRENAVYLFAYSCGLFAIALASTRFYAFRIIGAVFLIGIHECITRYGRRREMHGRSIFLPVVRGVKVLDMLPGSHASRLGLQRGEVILSVNGVNIRSEEGIKAILKDFPVFVWMNVLGVDGSEKSYEYKCYPEGVRELGIISIPRETEVTYNIDYFENFGIIRNLVARFRGLGS